MEEKAYKVKNYPFEGEVRPGGRGCENLILPYNPKLRKLARELRKQGIVAEVVIWKHIKNKALGVEFHRQVPLLEYIVDFYCHELMLAIEVDGSSHFVDGSQEKDKLRQQVLEKYGVNFIRFTNREVLNNLEQVLIDLRTKIYALNIPLNPLLKGEEQPPSDRSSYEI